MADVKKETDRLNTEDGVELFWRSWVPEKPAGVLLIVHGLAEHSGRYERTASHFAERGLACYGFDLRGHGRSEGRRAHVDRFADYLADVQAIRSLVARNHPGLPCFYLGHSMGGLIVVLRVLDNPSELNGAIVSSPLLAPHPSAEPSAVTKLASGLLSKLAPRMLISSGLDTSALSHDASVVEAYVNDPLVSKKVSARWFTTTMEAAARARQGAPGLKVPVLLMQSGDDRLVAPDATRLWAGAAPQKLVEFEWWDGFYHEMFNEPERARVFARVDRWLGERLPGYHA